MSAGGGRLSGRRYTLLRGLGIVVQDAPAAAAIRAAAALAAGAASGPFMVLAIESFITTALDAAGGQLPVAAVAGPVTALLALFAVGLLETGVRTITDARIEAGLRRGFRVDLTEKRARLAYRYVEHPETMDLIRRVQAGPSGEPEPTPERGPVKQAFDDLIEVAGLTVRILGITAVLARIGWWIIPVVIAIMVPTILLGTGGGRRVYQQKRRLAVLERRAEYLAGNVLQGRDAAGERALFGYSKYVNELWRRAFDKQRLLDLKIIDREANRDQVRERTSAVFQNFQRYQMTLRENVMLADVDAAGDEAALRQALADGGVPRELWGTKEGLDLMLSREFGERDLSLGEWQRLAIARGLFRGHDTIVLDEPTASIDPLEEAALYERFVEVCAGRTALIVTHRLGSARFADRIVVMENGRIVETGTHDELIAAGGLYHRMFTSQAAWYERS